MALTITIPGAVETTTGSTAPAVLTVGVGSPGVGVPSGGSTGQYLVKASATSYDTAWLTLPANYITSVTAPLAVTSGNLAVNLSAYLTTATAASTYQTIAGMSSYLTTASAASTYAVIAAGQPTSGTVGQVLTKASGTNYDSYWATPVIGDKYYTISTTSLAIGTGTKSLTVGTGLSYTTQQTVIVAYDAANHMHATVTSYNSSTGAMVISVSQKSGSGTYSSWTVNVGGVVSGSWGSITGTLSDQTDLQTALNAKLDSATAVSTYAPLASPVLTGTPLSTTAAADTNTTQIATTAYVVGQGYAKLASPTFSGTPTLPTGTIAVTQTALDSSTKVATTAFVTTADNLKANLASPTFTGTPTLPTGTIATTQSPGNNTTAVATTAFVTSAVPAFASILETLVPTSSTKVLSPSLIPFLLGLPGYRSLNGMTQNSVSGTGGVSQFGWMREVYTATPSLVGRATFSTSAYGSAAGYYSQSSAADARVINFSKKQILWGCFTNGVNNGTSYFGDSTNTFRVNFGGRSAYATGDLTQKGIGLKKAGGATGVINLTVHNGTTLTDVAASAGPTTPGNYQAVAYLIYSDGAGNVYLYLDGVLAAQTASGPTGASTSLYNVYEEQVESILTSAVRYAVQVSGAGQYIER